MITKKTPLLRMFSSSTVMPVCLCIYKCVQLKQILTEEIPFNKIDSKSI